MIQLHIHVDPRHDGWKQMQVHTKRSLTTIPTCGRRGSTTTNTKLTYNLFTPGPSVRLVENLAEDQLPLLLLLQVPEVVYWCITQLVLCWSKFLLVCNTRTFFAARLPAVDHHRQGIVGLVPHHVHAALRLFLATRPCAPFERPGIALAEMLR